MSEPTDAGALGEGHRLTRLGHEGRRFPRHDAVVACRLLFTRSGLHGVTTMLAVTRNVSRSGALLSLQHPVEAIDYVNVDFGEGRTPLASMVRHRRGLELGVEFFAPLTETALVALIAGAS